MANEKQTFVSAPVIDMEAVQKVANEAATKAVIKEVEEYYTGWNSPYRKQIQEWLKQNAPSVHFELPEFGAAVIQSVKAEVDRIAQQVSASNFMQVIRNGITHQTLQEDGTLLMSQLFKDMCCGLDLEGDNPYAEDVVSIEVTIEEDPSYHWQKMIVTITDDEGDRDYEVTLHKYGEDHPDCYQILSLPWKQREGWVDKHAKIRTADGHTIELPVYAGVCNDEVLLSIARCIMFKTPIRLDKTYFMEDNCHES